jgi:hypothetical protein
VTHVQPMASPPECLANGPPNLPPPPIEAGTSNSGDISKIAIHAIWKHTNCGMQTACVVALWRSTDWAACLLLQRPVDPAALLADRIRREGSLPIQTSSSCKAVTMAYLFATSICLTGPETTSQALITLQKSSKTAIGKDACFCLRAKRLR